MDKSSSIIYTVSLSFRVTTIERSIPLQILLVKRSDEYIGHRCPSFYVRETKKRIEKKNSVKDNVLHAFVKLIKATIRRNRSDERLDPINSGNTRRRSFRGLFHIIFFASACLRVTHPSSPFFFLLLFFSPLLSLSFKLLSFSSPSESFERARRIVTM